MLWKSPSLSVREREQRELKAKLLLEAMGALGLDALPPGQGDFVFGLEFLTEGAKRHSLPYVSANVRTTDGAEIFPAFRIVERAGFRVGITGVTAPSLLGQGVRSVPVEESLRKVVAELQSEKVDLVFLLSYQGLEADKKLASAVEGLDVIFSAHDRRLQVAPTVVGTTAIVQAGSRGKYLGVAELRVEDGRVGWADSAGRVRAERRRASLERQRSRYAKQLTEEEDERLRARVQSSLARVEQQLASLVIPPAADGSQNQLNGRQEAMNREIGDDPVMDKLVNATLELLGDTVDEGHDHSGHDHSGHNHGPGGHAAHGGMSSKTVTPRRAAPNPGPYVGAGVCMGCHPTQYKDWAATPHAHAWKTLVDEKRQFDQDCWSCHVTGANQKGGPSHPKQVGALGNVQCEACHGPGRAHVSSAGSTNPVRMVKSPSEAVCVTCHTMEQTEGRFVYDTYLPKVDHKD